MDTKREFILETERLIIYPLTDDEMRALIDAQENPDLKQAYTEMLQGCLLHPEARIWNAIWNIELREQAGTVVGDMSFKGLGDDGTVEIGYGTRAGYCNKGYMTEAVKRITQWALAQEGVARVEAETAPDNIASQRVLAKAGFIPNGQMGEEGPRFVYAGV